MDLNVGAGESRRSGILKAVQCVRETRIKDKHFTPTSAGGVSR